MTMKFPKYSIECYGGPFDGKQLEGVTGNVKIPDYSPDGLDVAGRVKAIYTPGTSEQFVNPFL